MRKKLVDFIVIMNIRVYTHDEHLCIHMYVYIHMNIYLRGNGNEAFYKYMEHKKGFNYRFFKFNRHYYRIKAGSKVSY